MATALDHLKTSLRLIHVLDASEEPSAAESQDALEAANTMLDSWSSDGLYIYTTGEEAVTWPASTESRTIGASGNFVTTRPTRIMESTFVRTATGEDYPVQILSDRQSYSWILDKDVETDWPEYLYYEPSYPDGTIYVWPVPTSAVTLYLHTPSQLSQIAALTTEIAYPPGYKELFIYSLAERLADQFGVMPPPGVMKRAFAARQMVKRQNKRHVRASLDVANIGTGTRYNIYSDTR